MITFFFQLSLGMELVNSGIGMKFLSKHLFFLFEIFVLKNNI